MLSRDILVQQLPFVLEAVPFDFLSDHYTGKVRDTFRLKQLRIMVTTDRLSCFDRVVTTVPFKGQVLNNLAHFWFRATSDIVSNHVVAVPDPNVLVARDCQILPVEVVVRAYLTGSAWRDYAAGNLVSGVRIPAGMRQSQRFEVPIVTPSTKEGRGKHDEPISEQEIISRGLVPGSVWEEVRSVALRLFQRGTEIAARQGLLLVDTKYEFGIERGQLVLADEIHTLDSSRFWVAESYHERFARGESPVMLDKEPTRQWLLAQGFKGEGPIPHFTDQHRVEIAEHYIASYERITGAVFEGVGGDPLPRIEKALRSLL
ncbi:MAG: phosphoribosylaminoimidazolesuccinocarboxamide synthase [Bdellovibrionota bacterium]|nr:MAG: phosphoribosylaminoimidazolesuccinocarboxamide synthase [Bdellovibrionota bacterium]